MYGPVWYRIVPYGPVLSRIVQYGPIWPRWYCMVAYGTISYCMVPYSLVFDLFPDMASKTNGTMYQTLILSPVLQVL